MEPLLRECTVRGELFKEHPSIFQVYRIESFGEPVVNLRQHVACFVVLALLLPQPRQAHHGAEFEGFGLLLLSDVDGFQEAGFGLCFRIWALGFRI